MTTTITAADRAAAEVFTPVPELLQRIVDKCSQYWNERGVCDEEYHAALGFIAHQVASIEHTLNRSNAAAEKMAEQARRTSQCPTGCPLCKIDAEDALAAYEAAK